MATMTQASPIGDLMYDRLSVLQSKAEGLNAYEKSVEDAEKEVAIRCVETFRRLHERDAEQVEEVKEHVKMMSKRPSPSNSRSVESQQLPVSIES